MIQNNKLYPCKECGSMVKIRSKGLCPKCRYKQRDRECKLKPQSKNIQKVEEKSSLNVFYSSMIAIHSSNPFSIESGKYIYELDRSNMCHILPKRTYKSVSCNADNIIILTIEEHARFDQLLDCLEIDRLMSEFPKTMRIVIDKIKKVLPLCRENGKIRTALETLINS